MNCIELGQSLLTVLFDASLLSLLPYLYNNSLSLCFLSFISVTFLLGLKMKSSRQDGDLKMFFMLSVVYSLFFYSSLFLLLQVFRVEAFG